MDLWLDLRILSWRFDLTSGIKADWLSDHINLQSWSSAAWHQQQSEISPSPPVSDNQSAPWHLLLPWGFQLWHHHCHHHGHRFLLFLVQCLLLCLLLPFPCQDMVWLMMEGGNWCHQTVAPPVMGHPVSFTLQGQVVHHRHHHPRQLPCQQHHVGREQQRSPRPRPKARPGKLNLI